MVWCLDSRGVFRGAGTESASYVAGPITGWLGNPGADGGAKGFERLYSNQMVRSPKLLRRSFVDNKSWLPNVPASTRMRSSEMLMACEALVTNDGDPFLRAL